MDFDGKEIQKIIRLLPFYIIGFIILSIFLYFVFRPTGSIVVTETESFKVYYDPTIQTYSLDTNENFYNQDPEKIRQDVQTIEEITGSTNFEQISDLPAFIFETGFREQEYLDNLDPNSFEYPENGYPGD